MAGAVLNIVLNLIWIPTWGAVGASLATFFSYFAVFVLRAATMHRYIRFNLQIPKITVNTVLLCGMVAIMMFEPPMWMLWIGLCTAVVVGFNAPALLSMLKMLPEMVKGRLKR
jgi:O-antigen/teichoic acid export membrane protein